jgi:UDP-glucose 4-epimerase
VDFSPEQLAFLQFGRGVDTRRLREDFGYEPRYDTAAAFDDFVTGSGLSRIVDPDRIEALGRTAVALAGAGLAGVR